MYEPDFLAPRAHNACELDQDSGTSQKQGIITMFIDVFFEMTDSTMKYSFFHSEWDSVRDVKNAGGFGYSTTHFSLSHVSHSLHVSSSTKLKQEPHNCALETRLLYCKLKVS